MGGDCRVFKKVSELTLIVIIALASLFFIGGK